MNFFQRNMIVKRRDTARKEDRVTRRLVVVRM